MSQHYSHLLSPGRIGAMELRNRIVLAAMGAQPVNSMLQQLQSGAAQVHSIGDCRDVGYIDGAMLDARNLVRQLETT